MAQDFTELIPGLPEEIALECLTRLHYTAHAVASNVCQRWRHLLQSKDFYYHRKKTGFTHKSACFVQSIPFPPGSAGSKNKPKYGLSIFEPSSGIWDRIDPVPKYPDGLPLFCQMASSEGKLVMMGGWNPENWEPVRDVFVYEFATRRWTQRVDMPSNRSFFAAGACDGKVYVAGGHDGGKNALRTAWVYDIDSDEWTELAHMSEERDECEGVVIGSGFWVVSGYDTDSQGQFKNTAEVLDTTAGIWQRVDDAWGVSRCPRACVAVTRNGNFTCWTESLPSLRVGVCGVDIMDRTLVTGSAFQGAPQSLYMVEKGTKGQNGKLNKVAVPGEFSGFVQSGCFVEI